MTNQKPASKSPFLSIRLKVLIPLMVLLTIFFCIAFFGLQFFLKETIFKIMEQESVSVRDAALDCIDPAVLQSLTQDALDDPETDWREDQRYADIQVCLDSMEAFNQRAEVFTYYQIDENTLGNGVEMSDYSDEFSFGEEMTADSEGEDEFGFFVDGLEEEVAYDKVYEYYDDDDNLKYMFGLASPIENDAGESIGGIVVYIDINDFVATLNKISAWLIVAFVLIYAVVAGIVLWVTGSATSQLRTLNAAALRVAEGDYTPIKVKSQMIGDEVATLAAVFNTMLDKVRGREETLKKRVAELEIVIDSKKREQQVNEIVDSEFFQDLTARAAKLRGNRKAGGEQKEEGSDGK
jgi:methyl-accepting chemotaxis protein